MFQIDYKQLNVVVYGRGHADYINEELATMENAFNVQVRAFDATSAPRRSSLPKYVAPSDSRDKIIARFCTLAREYPVHAVIFAHPLNPGAFDEKLLGCFLPTLRYVGGMGAGFDHGRSPSLLRCLCASTIINF